VQAGLALFLASLLAGCGNPISYEGEVNPSDILEARGTALEWLDSVSVSEPLGAKAMKLSALLQTRDVVALPDHSDDAGGDSPCAGDDERSVTLAFVLQPIQNSYIYVCPAGRDTRRYEMSQILIHEAIHLSGVRDECETTLLENLLVHASGRSPYRNAYVRSCGLQLDTPEDFEVAMTQLKN
jgi:hypothetical protein